MATTTNYAWETPDDTDLVKDGAAAIRTLGSSIDTTTKALNPSTTLGDIEYRSSTANTNTRLGIGTTGQILTVAGGVPSWATPATSSSGLVLIDRDSFTAASSVIWDGVFTSTYKVYQVVIETLFGSTSSADLWFNFRYSNTTMAAQYYGSLQQTISTTWSGTQWSALNSAERAIISLNVNAGANENMSSVFNVFNVGSGSSNRGGLYGQTLSLNPYYEVYGGYTTQLQNYNGFVLAPSTGTITGTVSIYGLATA